MQYLIPMFNEEIIKDNATGLSLSATQLEQTLELQDSTYLCNLQFCQDIFL